MYVSLTEDALVAPWVIKDAAKGHALAARIPRVAYPFIAALRALLEPLSYLTPRPPKVTSLGYVTPILDKSDKVRGIHRLVDL